MITELQQFSYTAWQWNRHNLEHNEISIEFKPHITVVNGMDQGLYSLRGRLIGRSREFSKPYDSCLDFFNRSEIWQAPRQQRCRDACQISERCDLDNIQSHHFET